MGLVLIFLILHSSLICSPRILCLGDSLTEGYGVSAESAWPALLQDHLRKNGYPEVEVINAGVSGSVSASGLSRLRWSLKAKPDIVFVCLGANDGLRGLPIEQMRQHLRKTLELAIAATGDVRRVIFAGIHVPTNYGEGYSQEFHAAFQALSEEAKVLYIPFLLEGVGGVSELNLSDGIHPNEAGHEKVLTLVLPTFLQALAHVTAK